MTSTDQQTILDRIEADRKKRERELLILLLLVTDDGRQHAQHAVRLGVDAASALRNVIVGQPALDQPGLADALAERMLEAYQGGVRRVFRLAGVNVDLAISGMEQEERAVRTAYTAYAVQATQSLYQRIADKVTDTLNLALHESINAKVRLIRDAMTKAGFTRLNPSQLEAFATDAVIRAYQDGYGNGWSTPIIRQKVKGFQFVAIIDDRTTEICRAYNGVRLPADDQWWKGHAPPCHFNCRSTYFPLWGDFEPTVLIPSIEPQPGWGTSAISPLTPYRA